MTSTAEVVAAACPSIGSIGGAFYFTDETIAVGKEHGLDGYRFYFLGRGGVLGDVQPAVVESAFGYFHPALVEKMWITGRERTRLSPHDAGRLYLQCCHDFGRRHLAGVPGLDGFCAAASAVNASAGRAGLALYAAVAAEPLPDDLPARAMQLAAVLREFRGSTHLLAVLATDGIDPATAHGIRRPDYWTTFGYDEDTRPAGTDEQQDALAAADELTDRLVAPAFDVLDQHGRAALLAGLEAMQQAMPGRSTARR
ncbi:MAG: SCO6745 family protein [Streptosporangiales bacterium]